MLLIKQAQIVDGSGSKPFLGDILINGDKISAIGKNISKKRAREVIDGLGLTAVPGFIDANNDSDHHLSLFTNPGQEDFIKQGITTIIGGQCGASLAPLIYGSLASIERWSATGKTNVDWTSVADLKNVLKRMGLKINFETFAGYSTIRRDITGGVEIRDLTAAELDIFANILKQAFNEGAIGVSTGLGFLDSKFTPFSEIKKMILLAAKRGKIYATHVHDEKIGLARSIEETLAMAKETGIKTIISHFRPIKGFEKQFGEAMNLIERNLVDSNIYFDVNPFVDAIFPIHSYLPYWAQSESVETMLDNLKNSDKRKMIAKELKTANLEELVVADARGQEALIGKGLLELSQNREKGAAQVLLDIMQSSKMNAMLMSKGVNQELLLPLLTHSRALIGTNSSSLTSPNSGRELQLERATSTFTKYLKTVSGLGVPVETAIKKITSFPAQLFGLRGRGAIKEGYFADIVLLKNGEVKNVILNGQNLF